MMLYAVWESYIEDQSLIALFYSEADADKCSEYLNSLNRPYKCYYVEEAHLYKSFNDYDVDVKST